MGDFYVGGSPAMTSKDETWTTPKKTFDDLNKEFNFGLDAAALQSSALCSFWYGPDNLEEQYQDAFTRDWHKDCTERGITTVFLNPPYGRTIKQWMKKAHKEALKGLTIVCLVPARTDTSWWWDSCIMHEVRFVRGRLKFGGGNAAPFPSAIVVMKPNAN